MTRSEEVWLRAFCAYVSSFNGRTEAGVRTADECLNAFEKRFPPPKPLEAQWCGKPISELTPDERSQMYWDGYA